MIKIFFALTVLTFGDTTLAIEVQSAWVRATIGKRMVTGAFMQISSPDREEKLLAASCSCAKSAEIHRTTREDGMVAMDQVPHLTIKQGETVNLKPGSFHIMLMGLKKQLKPNQTVKLDLKFQHSGLVTVDAKVIAP